MTTERFLDFKSINNVVWFCTQCDENMLRKKAGNRFNILNSYLQDLIKPISISITEHSAQLKSLASANQDLQIIIKQLENKLVDTSKNIAELEIECRNNKQKVDSILSQRSNTNIDHDYIHDKLDWVDRMARSNNLLLCGVPIIKNEDLIHIIKNLICQLGINLAAVDFTAYRMHSAKNTEPPAILIKFKERSMKDNLFGCYLDMLKKKSYLDLSNIDHSASSSRVYLNHHLTNKMSKIFYKARSMVRSRVITHAFTSFGSIYIKETGENSPKIKILTLEQLSRYEKNGTKKQVSQDKQSSSKV